MFVQTKQLPQALQSTLKALGYHKKDISLQAKDSISPQIMGNQGQRGFFSTVNLETGETTKRLGSWGGSNVFCPTNQVDLDEQNYAIPVNVVCIKGTEGYPNVSASLYARPETLAPLLPQTPTITDKQAAILVAFRGLKSGPYRQEELARLDATSEDLNSLVGLGMLKRSSNGATAITIEGKNATQGKRSPSGLTY
jgi:hypothetical protein